MAADMNEPKEKPVLSFMKWPGKILAPPRFEDEGKNRLSRALNILLLNLAIASILVVVATFASAQFAKSLKFAGGGAAALLLLVLLRRGRLQLAISLTFPALLLMITYVLFGSGGIHDLSVLLYPVVIVVAGLLLRPREFIAITVLSMLSAAFIIVSELTGLIDVSSLRQTSFFTLINVAAAFIITAVPVRLLANDLFRSIARARENERELRESNLRLQREIGERLQAEMALRESETRFRILAESTFEGLCVSENGIIIDTNSSMARMLACATQDIVGRKISDFLDREAVERANQQFESESSAPYEHLVKRADGSLLPVETRNKMIPFQGRTVRVTTYHDISERRRSEEEHRILEAEMRQNQKLESLGTLAGGIAHDFNNIISIISGHAAVLAGKLKGLPSAQASLRTINETAERGSAMVRQILTFARKSEAEFRSFKIQELVADLVKMLRMTFPRTIEISYSSPGELPPVWMDPNQLQQALLNLCINARDAMSGTGKLEIATTVIAGKKIASRFPAAEGKRLIRIQITDSGVGMNEKTRTRIYEPFFTTKGRGRGTGLGLAVVYGVVQAHKGFIEVDSQLGRGTSFSLYFSTAEPKTFLSPHSDQKAEPIARGSETILVIEDEEDLRELLTIMLHDYGYRILMARDGLEALECYRRHRNDIQLVITDMDLPKINGAAVSQSILSDNPEAKIILISGFVEMEQKNSILAGGVREFVAKPYTLPQMLRTVRKVLDSK